MAKEQTQFPGWPNNIDWPPLDEWLVGMTKVSPGEGLMGTDIGGPLYPDQPPHPGYVKQWRERNNASVATTAEHFRLSDVQVLQACR